MIDYFRGFCYNSILREHRFLAMPEVCQTVLDELKTAKKVVGIKQIRKALAAGDVKKVFLAEDADPALTEPVAEQCRELSVTLIFVPTMKQLGAACEISVAAAAAAIL